MDGRKERNVLFNDALNTFYLQLYGIKQMVKDHWDIKRGNLQPPTICNTEIYKAIVSDNNTYILLLFIYSLCKRVQIWVFQKHFRPDSHLL